MFERFTQGARDAVIQAQSEAAEFGDREIGTQHILLGALWNAEGAAKEMLDGSGLGYREIRGRIEAEVHGVPAGAEALQGIGIDLDEVRRRAEDAFGKGALSRRSGRSQRGHIPFGRDAKKTLELALREAVAIRHSAIGTEHVLLGLAGQPKSPAGELMTAVGVSPEEFGGRLRDRLRHST